MQAQDSNGCGSGLLEAGSWAVVCLFVVVVYARAATGSRSRQARARSRGCARPAEVVATAGTIEWGEGSNQSAEITCVLAWEQGRSRCRWEALRS